MDMYERGADVLDGVVQDERTFYYIAELDEDDDIDDPGTGSRPTRTSASRPAPGHGPGVGGAKDVPAERGDFITKRLNLFVRSAEQAFVDFEVLKRNERSIDPEVCRPALRRRVRPLADRGLHRGVPGVPARRRPAVRAVPLLGARGEGQARQREPPVRRVGAAGTSHHQPGRLRRLRLGVPLVRRSSKFYPILRITYDPANAYRLAATCRPTAARSGRRSCARARSP